MKRFWLFGGEVYYGHGGMHDFRQSYDTGREAVEAGEKLIERSPVHLWYHVFDSEMGKVIIQSKEEPHGGPHRYDDPEQVWGLLDA